MNNMQIFRFLYKISIFQFVKDFNVCILLYDLPEQKRKRYLRGQQKNAFNGNKGSTIHMVLYIVMRIWYSIIRPEDWATPLSLVVINMNTKAFQIPFMGKKCCSVVVGTKSVLNFFSEIKNWPIAQKWNSKIGKDGRNNADGNFCDYSVQK